MKLSKKLKFVEFKEDISNDKLIIFLQLIAIIYYNFLNPLPTLTCPLSRALERIFTVSPP